MRLRVALLAAAAAGLALSLCAEEGRGPSTQEEREKAVRLVRSLEADPLGESAKDSRQWLTLWLIEVPDITVSLCAEFFPELLGSEKKHASELVMQSSYSMAAFVIEHPEKAGDQDAKYQAGVEGTLKAYEAILKKKPEARWPVLDELLAKREKAELAEFIRVAAQKCRAKHGLVR